MIASFSVKEKSQDAAIQARTTQKQRRGNKQKVYVS